MSVQALISSCAGEKLPCEMEAAEMPLCECFRGPPAPREVTAPQVLAFQGFRSTLVPFAVTSAAAKGVPAVCGAEEMLGGGGCQRATARA